MNIKDIWKLVLSDLCKNDVCNVLLLSKWHYELQYMIFDKYYFNLDNVQDLSVDKYHLVKNVCNVLKLENLLKFPCVRKISLHKLIDDISVDISSLPIVEIYGKIIFEYPHYLPKKLKYLNVECTNKQLLSLPNSLRHLTLCVFKNDLLQTLPNSITHLTINGNYRIYVELPYSLTHLTFGDKFDKMIDISFLSALTHLTFGDNFNKKIYLPAYLIHVTFGWEFNQIISLPASLTHLTFGYHFDQKISLPTSLTHLTFGKRFDQKIDLSLCSLLTNLTFGDNFNKPINKLPASLKKLIFGSFFNHNLQQIIPDSLEYLKLGRNFNKYIDNLCVPGLKKLVICHLPKEDILNLPNPYLSIKFKIEFDIQLRQQICSKNIVLNVSKSAIISFSEGSKQLFTINRIYD